MAAVLGLNNAAQMTLPTVSVPTFPGSYRPANLWLASGTARGSRHPAFIRIFLCRRRLCSTLWTHGPNARSAAACIT